MDVGTMARTQTNAYTSYANFSGVKARGQNAAAAEDQETKADSGSDAYAVNLSDAAKQAQATENAGSSKGLSSDALSALNDQQAAQQATFYSMMIQAMTETNDKLQGWLNDGIGILRFGDVTIDASRFAMPEVATTPEEAAKAVADGGDWSVDAVAGRIFDLASAIAGNDPDKLQTMRDAVEKGFQQAGVAFKSATGQSSMPKITDDTYAEIMSRFDSRAKELSGDAS